jgi:hypothetical protein
VVVAQTECPYVDGIYDLAMSEVFVMLTRSIMKGFLEMKFTHVVKQSVKSLCLKNILGNRSNTLDTTYWDECGTQLS